MSAVVGILNTQAIAIAADSAVTINGKIYNRALKIFTLSKFRPVGIMIYSSATFMQTPWETIIKMYRTNLKEKSFPTLKDYVDDFMSYIKLQDFFNDEAVQKDYISSSLFYRLLMNVYDLSFKEVKADFTIIDSLNTECDKLTTSWGTDQALCNEFNDFQLEQFDIFLNESFEQVANGFFESKGVVNVSQEIKEKLKKIAVGIIRNKEQFTYYTGLVFAGFGENQIFPSLISINIHFGIQNRLKFYETDNIAIRQNMTSAIRPFAQTDAMNTILRGIAPSLDNIYSENMHQYIEKYNQRLISIIEPQFPDLANAIRAINIDDQMKDFTDKIHEAKSINYINPLLDAVSTLSKEDLAEMAESLIYLTYLQKKITFAAEDVGGAVDVAVISKGDGFIWIKRKHYFKPELNRFFFDNYFK